MGSTDQADPRFLLQIFMNIDGTTLILFLLSPRLVTGPQKPQTLTASKPTALFIFLYTPVKSYVVKWSQEK